jgi:hypothetical protein
VKNDLASGHRFFERRRRTQVAGDSVRLEPFQVAQIAGLAHQQAQFGPLFGQNSSDVRAQKTGCACDKSFQKQFSVASSQFPVGG